jgi:hypothetical protein
MSSTFKEKAKTKAQSNAALWPKYRQQLGKTDDDFLKACRYLTRYLNDTRAYYDEARSEVRESHLTRSISSMQSAEVLQLLSDHHMAGGMILTKHKVPQVERGP